MLPLTPNMLLLGRSSDSSPPLIYSEDQKFCSRLAYVSQVEQEWWDRWHKSVLPTLFPYKKWKKKQENVAVGDVVMLKYPGHFKDDYCLARVSEVYPDEEGLVRTCQVQYRKKNPKEALTVFKSKPLISEKVTVHRLHPLGLADEVAAQCQQAVQDEVRDEGVVQCIQGGGDVSESEAIAALHGKDEVIK